MKPQSRMVEPATRPLTAEQREDANYVDLKRREEAELARRKKEDKIGKFLGATFYFIDKGWPWLNFHGTPLSVSRFYQTENVAIDIFQKIGDEEKREIALKRAEFKARKIRYGALSWSDQLADLIPQIGL